MKVTPLILPSKITKIPSIKKVSYFFTLKDIFIILLDKINSVTRMHTELNHLIEKNSQGAMRKKLKPQGMSIEFTQNIKLTH